ncbi:hypothetical protein H257_16368 [Aphanomyces astaci]|uniref:Uncharacterized protein n=1 Tax=Aphanomyces astaci TaxID=112090 RepID=W4FJ41_APHAT|nr:hypothetical protein H257_16368 [Aphanomyces astaci]ETV67522.1 hypothetical protein H257_16368 [Aphanomyces astaci]|eukprot:XP_009843081.1 hypothetical protein H257_16368 [Aphanomyces astaci]
MRSCTWLEPLPPQRMCCSIAHDRMIVRTNAAISKYNEYPYVASAYRSCVNWLNTKNDSTTENMDDKIVRNRVIWTMQLRLSQQLTPKIRITNDRNRHSGLPSVMASTALPESEHVLSRKFFIASLRRPAMMPSAPAARSLSTA